MSWVNIVFNKIKFLIVSIIELLRYVCCTGRSRRRPSVDHVPLSSVGVVPSEKFLHISSDDDIRYPPSSTISQPRNVQDYINQYRQQKCKQMTSYEVQDVQTDFFQDMEPKIIQQQKVLVTQKENQSSPSMVNSRLAFVPVTASAITKGNELASWEEMENNGNWDVDELNANQMLKEERQLERERRMIENSKKRMDKERTRLGSKIS